MTAIAAKRSVVVPGPLPARPDRFGGWRAGPHPVQHPVRSPVQTPLHKGEFISSSVAARLFLVVALLLLGALLRPADAAPLPAPDLSLCLAAPAPEAAVVGADAREDALRQEHGRAQTLAGKLARDGRGAPRLPGVSRAAAASARIARRRGRGVAGRPRLRAHAARGPPGRA
ncbi:MAG: hypothetical protein ACFE0R_01630 [Salinarimonas sp.]